MKLPVFDTCCCGCTLRTGSLIIGYAGAAISLIFVIVLAVALDEVPDVSEVFDYSWRSFYISVLVITLLVYIAELAFYCLLVIGAHKSHTRYLRIFVAWATVLLCFSALNVLLNFITVSLVNAFAGLAGLVLQAYFILIVRSFHMELESLPVQTNINFNGQPQYGLGQPGFPAQPEYPAQPGYPGPIDPSVQPGYSTQMGPQVNPVYAK